MTPTQTIQAARKAITARKALDAKLRTKPTSDAVRAFLAQHKAAPSSSRTFSLALTVLDLIQLERLGADAIAATRKRSEIAARAGRARAAVANYDVATIRAWARTQGLDVPAVGRYLPPHIVQAYRHAHPPKAGT